MRQHTDKAPKSPRKSALKTAGLRNQTEARISSSPAKISKLSTTDISKLMRQLQLHQAELEMQNEELLRSQAELESSRQRYIELYDFAPVGYLTFDEEGVILKANVTVSEMLGMNRRDLISKPLQHFICRDFQDTFSLHLRDVFSSKSKQRCQLLLHRADGTTFDAGLESIAAARGHKGQRCFLTILSDISESKQSEAELRESELRLRAFLENSAVIGWLKNEKGQHVFLSENYERRFGVSLEDWKGKTDFDLWPREIAEEFRRNDLAVLATDKPLEVIETTVDRNGNKTWWLNHKFSFRNSEGERFVGGLGVDITERKRAEEALRESESRMVSIIESAMDGIITVDESQHIVLINSAAEHLFGYKTGSLIGKPLSILIPQRFRSEHAEHVEHFGQTGETNRRLGELGSVRGLRASGEEFPIEASISQVEVGSKRLFTVILRDITERRWIEIRRKLQFVTTRALAESTTLAQAAPAILQTACELLDWSFGEIWERSSGAKALRLVTCWHSPSLPLESFAMTTRGMKFTKGTGLPGKVWATRRPAWIGEVAKDPSFLRREAAARHGLQSALAYPILMGSEVIGVMVFFTPKTHGNPQDLMQIFAAIGAQIAQFMERRRAEVALAVEQQRNVRALELRARQQVAISKLAQHALSNKGLSTVFNESVTIVREVLGFEFCEVLELQAGGDSLLMRAGTGWKEGCIGQATLQVGPNSQAGFTLLSNEPVIVEDLRRETRFSASKLLLNHSVLSGITVLIHGRQQPYGVLGAHLNRPRKFTADDLHFLQSVANVLAASVERRGLEEELLKISNREQRWIGQDLHDGLCQTLAGLRMKTEFIARNLSDDAGTKSELREIAKRLGGAVKEARMVARGLSPVDIESYGLMSALEELTESVASLHQVSCRFSCDRPVLIEDNTVAIHLYRIAQEAIHNAVRHGHAKNLVVSLSRAKDSTTLAIADDGSGFPADACSSRGMGIRIMGYRAEMINGSFSIGPREPTGTRVECTFTA